MKRLLLFIMLSPFAVPFVTSCKHPKTECKAIVKVVDSLDKPVADASVRFYLDGSTQNDTSKNTITGLPDTLYTDVNGKVTRDFTNGIVVRIDAWKGAMYTKNDYIALQPGETQEKTIKIKIR